MKVHGLYIGFMFLSVLSENGCQFKNHIDRFWYAELARYWSIGKCTDIDILTPEAEEWGRAPRHAKRAGVSPVLDTINAQAALSREVTVQYSYTSTDKKLSECTRVYVERSSQYLLSVQFDLVLLEFDLLFILLVLRTER